MTLYQPLEGMRRLSVLTELLPVQVIPGVSCAYMT